MVKQSFAELYPARASEIDAAFKARAESESRFFICMCSTDCVVDESKEAREDRPGQRRLGHVEDGIAGMPHHPGASLDRPLAAAILSGDLSGQIKHAVEIFALHTTLAQNLKMGAIFTIVSFALPPSACMRAASSSARTCPPLCAARRRRADCRRPADPLVRQASVGDVEADAGERLAGMERHPGHDPAGFRPAPGPVVEAGVPAHDMVRRSTGAALDQPSDPYRAAWDCP